MGLFSKWFGGQADAVGDPQRIAELEHALDELRPILAADGGDVDVCSVTDEGAIELRWRGACAHCGARETTAGQGLEPLLRARLSWFSELTIR